MRIPEGRRMIPERSAILAPAQAAIKNPRK